MRTKRRALGSLAIAALVGFVGDGAGNGLAAQEADEAARAGDAIVAIDVSKGRDLDETQVIRVQVRNDLIPTGSVVVSLVSLTRPELVLGAVLSNESREWLIDSRFYQGDFQLVATGSQAGTQVSRRINVANQTRVKWSLGTGLVRVERLETDDGVEGES
ncbi:MAG: hypothetical protein MJB57_04785 [Gemmatimonadetes bacterium]|nr:hypothetical protein [Gemmatimonadota bacterium]